MERTPMPEAQGKRNLNCRIAPDLHEFLNELIAHEITITDFVEQAIKTKIIKDPKFKKIYDKVVAVLDLS
jgi:hypothetical protein